MISPSAAAPRAGVPERRHEPHGSARPDSVDLDRRASHEMSRKSLPKLGPSGTPALERVWQRFEQLTASCAWATLVPEGGLEVLCQARRPADESDRREVDARGRELAHDPSKGEAIRPGGIEEAAVALMAEHYGVLDQPVEREVTGQAEFVDGQGRNWDVKSPVSPPPGVDWVMDVPHQLEKVRRDLSQGDRILLNLSQCTVSDATALLDWLDKGLQGDDRSRVAVLADMKALQSAEAKACPLARDSFAS